MRLKLLNQQTEKQTDKLLNGLIEIKTSLEPVPLNTYAIYETQSITFSTKHKTRITIDFYYQYHCLKKGLHYLFSL